MEESCGEEMMEVDEETGALFSVEDELADCVIDEIAEES